MIQYKKIAIVVCMVVGMVACSPKVALQKEMLGNQAPLVRLTAMDGSLQLLSDNMGKKTLIVFWASWCSKSKQLLYTLAEMDRADNIPGVQVLTISVDKNTEQVKVVEEIGGLNAKRFKNFYSGNEVYDEAYMAFNGDSLPFLVMLDNSAKVIEIGDDLESLKKAGFVQ